jgi:hypothetical protein
VTLGYETPEAGDGIVRALVSHWRASSIFNRAVSVIV